MPKSIKNSFYKNLTFEKMLEAYKRASLGKKNKLEVIKFEIDLETNIIKIIDDIKNNTYQFGSYHEYIIYEPKERIIQSLPFKDRVVHQWYVEEFIKPYFFKRFIKDTYACLEKRGTHVAVKNLQKYMRIVKKEYGNYYILKCDIKKYFNSINKEILMNILKKRIKDKKIIEFSQLILDDGNKVGIPIGNYTSQYYANIYLNELDYFIKHNLNIKYYVRYMDDFILLVKTKEEAINNLKSISKFIENNLELKLNSKSTYFKNKRGIDFCGYHIYETHILLRKRFKKKTNKSIKLWIKLLNNNKFRYPKFLLSYNSYKGHASHANSYNFMIKLRSKIELFIKI